jgi:hypothetical protein
MDMHDEIGNFSEDLAFGHVIFVVAKHPSDRLDLEFEGFQVDAIPVPLNLRRPIPGGQGFGIDVGAFQIGAEIEVHWQFRCGIDVPSGQIVIGHCPNWRLTKLVRLERRHVEPSERCSGAFKVKPE